MKIILLIGLVSMGLVSCGKREPTEQDIRIGSELSAQQSVKNLMKDPSSVKFRNMKGACGEVNAKNGFGGYTGFKRFIGTPNMTLIEGESGFSQETFNGVWDKFCSKQ